MATTVFIASTCYDLLDLRAELGEHLRSLGLVAVLSDSAASDFQVATDANSIETCLANVRSCDEFIIVLSRRYGPSLKDAGYPDLSATHLEYQEARKHNKPIRMYVRDRLEADYAVWRVNKERTPAVQFRWVGEKDTQIFGLMDEHQALAASATGSNWFWVFRDSLELKRRIEKDFRAPIGAAALERLVAEGRTALLTVSASGLKLGPYPHPGRLGFSSLRLTILNAGAAPALNTRVELTTEGDSWGADIGCLLPEKTVELSPGLSVPDALPQEQRNVDVTVECRYTTPQGHLVADEWRLALSLSTGGRDPQWALSYSGKRYLHSEGLRFTALHDDPRPQPG